MCRPDARVGAVGVTGSGNADAIGGSGATSLCGRVGEVLGAGRIHFIEGVVLDDGELCWCKEAYPDVCVGVEAWIDSESVGFC